MDAIVPRFGNNPPKCGGQAPTHKNGGNGHRYRPRRQVFHGHRRAALKADTAVLLVSVTGMAVTEAIGRCDTSSDAFYAMKALRESGHTTLCNQVLQGNAPIRESAAQVENAAAAITAFKKCSASERELVRRATGFTADPVTMLLNMSSDQRVAISQAVGLDWVWDNMIEAAMLASEAPSKAPSESVSASRVA